MKRLFTYITMLVLAVACETMYGRVQTSIKGDKAGSITVTVDEVKDNSVTFTVSPASESAYYSYMVQAGNEAAEVDATTLYSNGYKKAAGVVASASVKWTAEKSSTTVTVSSLASNTTYQIYAVAGSPMGFPGDVVNTSFKTSDTVTPAYKNIESDEDVITVEFSENVTYNEESDPIKITYYAPYSAAFKSAATPAGSVDVPAESIEVAGTEATITVPEIPTGSYYTIAIPEGAFVDVVGLELPAYSSTMEMVETEDGPVPSPTGFYGEISYVELPMLGELELEYFSEWDSGFVIPTINDYPFVAYSTKKFVTVTYETSTENSESSTVYTLKKGVDYQITSLGFVVNLPEEPAIGANVTISVPAGCVYDIFGNDCEAWEHTMKYSYGYTLADIVGTYDMVQTSALDGKPYTTKMVIEASDDAKKGNVMITTYEDYECTTPIYATFDMDGGTLTIPAPQAFAKEADGMLDVVLTSLVANGNQLGIPKNPDPIIFDVEEPNVITGPNYYYGVVYYYKGAPYQFYNAYYITKATLAAPADETTSQPLSVKKFSLDAPIVKFF